MLLLAMLGGCAEPTSTSEWYEQLEADSPCYQVNLLDGLDETSAKEISELFDCLNYHGHLVAFEPAAETFGTATSTTTSVGSDLSMLVNGAATLDLDLVESAAALLNLLEDGLWGIEVTDIALELIYGTRSTKVRGGGVDLTDPASLDAGVIAPAAPLAQTIATLFSEPENIETAQNLLTSTQTERWLIAFEGLSRSFDEDVATATQQLLLDFGELFEATNSPENARWSDANDNSLRDMVDVLLLDDEPVIGQLSEELLVMLSEEEVRHVLVASIVASQSRGDLSEAISEIGWLASVDIYGNPLSANDDSALTALLRLLHSTNGPMTCSLDLWVTNLDIEFGNLAVAILIEVSKWDPEDAQGSVDILSSLLGLDLTELIMDEIAASGTCSLLTPQVVEDLGSIDQLASPEATQLLYLSIETLGALEQLDGQQIEAVVNLVDAYYSSGAVPPTEELLRDISDTHALDDAALIVGALANPKKTGLYRYSDSPPDLDDALVLLADLLEEDDNGRHLWEDADDWLALLDDDDLWGLLSNFAGLCVEEEATIHQLIPGMSTHSEGDGFADTRAFLTDLIGKEELRNPILRVLDSTLITELLATSPSAPQDEVPLTFTVNRILDGTMEDILVIVDRILDTLEVS